jgi:hypothetical protein
VDCGLGGNWREILDNATELQTDKVLLRALVIRPPQELVAGLEEVDPERWANRRDLLEEVVHRVMDAEMERAGVQRPDGTKQPLDLPYSYVIHAPDDRNGVESPHAHVIVPAMDRDGARAGAGDGARSPGSGDPFPRLSWHVGECGEGYWK